MITAMQELIESLQNDFKTNTRLKLKIESFNNFLEKEKEQIEIAFDLGRDEVTSVFIIDGEDYYNKKFKQNKS
jgi:hypothetical protein